MLIDKTNGKLDEVIDFAAKYDKSDNLQRQLDYLDNYYDRDKTRCLLFTDFAPQSFAFEMQRKKDDQWEYWFSGGMIFHGNHDGFGSGAAPTYSVCLNPTDGWSIHT